MKYKQILAVVGLRRVGKTVLLRQILEVLTGKAHPQNLCYISFDDRDFQKLDDSPVNRLVEILSRVSQTRI